MIRFLPLAVLLAGTGFGQAHFDGPVSVCLYAFPSPCGASGDAEGVSWNGLVGGDAPGTPTIDTANAIGMPCDGTKYARIHGHGPLAVPVGGPMPGFPMAGAQLFIPIPTGAVSVSFCWDYYCADTLGDPMFNDGMSIDLIGACNGPTLANLAFADGFTPNTGFGSDVGSPCAAGGSEVLPAGAPQSVVGAAIPTGASFLRVTVWNGGDDSFYSDGVIDQVCFNGTCGPAATCSLVFSSPNGSGSLRVQNLPCPTAANMDYLLAVTLTGGAFPNGWYFGLDIPLSELISQFNIGFPFRGTLDGSGASNFGPTGPGTFPAGMQLWAVTSTWTPGFGTSLGARPALTYVIP
jgi:hypothetical protein